jgi:hypothetical protein
MAPHKDTHMNPKHNTFALALAAFFVSGAVASAEERRKEKCHKTDILRSQKVQ